MDCSEFRNQNKVPMFPGMVNRWVAARADMPGLTETGIRAEVEEAILSQVEFDDLVIKKVTQDGLLLLAPPIAKRREQLTVLPLLQGGRRPWSISLEFNYRGTSETLPWPIVGPPFSACDLTQLNWTLMQVGQPVKQAAPETTISDVLIQTGEKVERAVAGPTKLLLGIAAVGAVGYLWFRKIL